MLDQVMELHRGRIRFLHIGCDEVFHLVNLHTYITGNLRLERNNLLLLLKVSCSKCSSRLKRLNGLIRGSGGIVRQRKSGRHIFLEHVNAVARYVRVRVESCTEYANGTKKISHSLSYRTLTASSL